jgi:hypothetical protein
MNKLALFLFLLFAATIFLDFWKRTEKEIQYEWDVESFEDTEVRTSDFNSHSPG